MSPDEGQEEAGGGAGRDQEEGRGAPEGEAFEWSGRCGSGVRHHGASEEVAGLYLSGLHPGALPYLPR
uniref:Uncharacterized protein n=1 Tax=Anguilla anguilla TaxID=7936 RepID=A0A0E9T7M3_ANGAN